MSRRTLVVGLGQVGMGYDLTLDAGVYIYSHARAVSLHPAFELVAGVDPNAHARDLFERTYSRPAFPDVESAGRSQPADFAIIASPTPLHAKILDELLATVRPSIVLCEKPLAYTLRDAVAMVRDCAAHEVKLFVNYMRRSDPGVVEVKRRLDCGEIGTPVKGIVWYSKGFLHNGSHFFNLLEYWLGEFQSAAVIDSGRKWGGADTEPDLRAIFARGTMLFLAAREENFSHYTVELIAPNGRLRYEQGGRNIYWQVARQDPDLPAYTVLSTEAETIPSGQARYQWHVIDELAAMMDGRDAHLCTGADAFTTLQHMHQTIANP
jgi:predicted dehydrogenase